MFFLFCEKGICFLLSISAMSYIFFFFFFKYDIVRTRMQECSTHILHEYETLNKMSVLSNLSFIILLQCTKNESAIYE